MAQAPDTDWTFTISGQTIDLDTTYPAIVEKAGWSCPSRAIKSFIALQRSSKLPRAKFTV